MTSKRAGFAALMLAAASAATMSLTLVLLAGCGAKQQPASPTPAEQAEPTDDASQEPEQTAPKEDLSSYTVHFAGADFVLPEPWWGEVDPTFSEGATDEQITCDGLVLLGWDQEGATRLRESLDASEPMDYGVVGTQTLDDGTTLTFGRGNDCVCSVAIEHPDGRSGLLWTFACSDFLGDLGVDANALASCLRLQASAAGVSEDGDPFDIADAYLRACVDRLTIAQA